MNRLTHARGLAADCRNFSQCARAVRRVDLSLDKVAARVLARRLQSQAGGRAAARRMSRLDGNSLGRTILGHLRRKGRASVREPAESRRRQQRGWLRQPPSRNQRPKKPHAKQSVREDSPQDPDDRRDATAPQQALAMVEVHCTRNFFARARFYRRRFFSSPSISETWMLRLTTFPFSSTRIMVGSVRIPISVANRPSSPPASWICGQVIRF